jgi:hypothetical protein
MTGAPQKTYVGLYEDKFGGMTTIGGIIKDAWLFGLIPETETCKGWDMGRMQGLYEQVSDKWQEYGFRVANLPTDLQERHTAIHEDAIRRAREMGWNPDADIADEE